MREIIFALRQPGKDQHWYANFGYYADSESRLTYGNGGKLCRLDLANGSVDDNPRRQVTAPSATPL